MKKIMIVDDDVAVTNYLMVFLMQTDRYEVSVVNDSRQAASLLAGTVFDVMLLDMDMPHISGMDILKIVRDKGVGLPVIVLTGVADVDLAVRAMKLGAFDYLTKPVDDEQLLQIIDSALEHRALHRSLAELPPQLKREDLHHRDAFEALPSQNPGMIRLLHQAERMAAGHLPIFICGERGSGKEMLGRAIHRVSPRRERPFVAIDASAQDPERFPSALFGQARLWGGSSEERPGFLEEAAGGSLYLGEVQALSFPMQVRLKRVLQEGDFYREGSTHIRQIDIRFIGSSSCDPTSIEAPDRFTGELFCHLAINSIHIPPLRERQEDIPLLAEQFLRQVAPKLGRSFSGFHADYLAFLAQYSFPDNTQELRNIVEASAVNAEGSLITVDDLPPFIRRRIAGGDREAVSFQPRPLEEVIRDHASRTLAFFQGSRTQAAEALGVEPVRLDELLED